MAANTRFATGVHAMVLLAAEPEVLHTSDEISARLETNAVVIRRAFAQLHHAGLIASHKGPTGGSRLARPAKEITLAEIYKALELGDLFHTAAYEGDEAQQAAGALLQTFRKLERSLREELSRLTLAQITRKATRTTAKAQGKKKKGKTAEGKAAESKSAEAKSSAKNETKSENKNEASRSNAKSKKSSKQQAATQS